MAQFKRETFSAFSSGIDFEQQILHLERGVKEIWQRDGLQAKPGRDVKAGKLKTAASNRMVPIHDAAILRQEAPSPH